MERESGREGERELTRQETCPARVSSDEIGDKGVEGYPWSREGEQYKEKSLCPSQLANLAKYFLYVHAGPYFLARPAVHESVYMLHTRGSLP